MSIFFKKILSKLTSFYYLHHFMKTPIKKNALLIESEHGDGISESILAILIEMQQNEYEKIAVSIAYTNASKRKITSLISYYNLTNIKLIKIGTLAYFKRLATAKHLLTDRFFTPLFIKREAQIYTLLWDSARSNQTREQAFEDIHKYANVKRNVLMANFIILPDKNQKKDLMATYSIEKYTSTKLLYAERRNSPTRLYSIQNENMRDITLNYKYSDFVRFSLQHILLGKTVSNLQVESIKRADNVPNGLFYVGSLSSNGLTSAFISLASVVGNTEGNIIATFIPSKDIQDNPQRLQKIPKHVDIFPMSDTRGLYTLSEGIAYKLYCLNIRGERINRLLDRHFKREIKRHFANMHIDYAIHQTGYGKRSVALLQRFSIPTAIFVHSDMMLEARLNRIPHVLTLQDAYNNYNHIVCVSDAVIAPTLKMGAKQEAISIVNNFIDYEMIKKKASQDFHYDNTTEANKEESLVAALTNETNCLKFINIGRFSPEKGHIRLIDAFERFTIKHPNALLTIIGGRGSEWNALNKYAEVKQCYDRIILIKSLDNPFPLLKRHNLFIFSSYYEGFGLALLEAQICGIPSISTDTSGPHNIMEEYGGYLVDNSEDGLLQGMLDYAENKVYRMKFNPHEYTNKVITQYHIFITTLLGLH